MHRIIDRVSRNGTGSPHELKYNMGSLLNTCHIHNSGSTMFPFENKLPFRLVLKSFLILVTMKEEEEVIRNRVSSIAHVNDVPEELSKKEKKEKITSCEREMTFLVPLFHQTASEETSCTSRSSLRA
ncbi:hypothetical protein GcM1_205029 [Golovinomyces cichoracearum]|uniref:Uncharacterized protein n=1 Tax=Golovinomyces cichoracearum TaxID=62708 RepID=A0A420IX42_9PEZI|nr:hypothetical protein GcM1_205029 [Golovinomyces cichoracearum]